MNSNPNSSRRLALGPLGRWMASAVLACAGLAPSLAPAAQVEQAWAVHQAPVGATGHEVAALEVDQAGNVYVAGQSHFPGSKWDIILTRYDPDGARLWQARYDEGFDADYPSDFASAVAVRGEVSFVAGSTRNQEGNSDFVTLKFDAAGALAWVAHYDGPGHGFDQAVAVVADASGQVVVAGHSPGITSHLDLAAVKYDAAGNPLWTFRYDGPSQNDDRLAAMRLDAQGNVHLVGTSGYLTGRMELVAIKLGPDGQLLWTQRRPSAPLEDIEARGMALDGEGSLVVTATDAWEVLTLKYGPDGHPAWEARYRAEESAGMVAGGVRVDADGNVITGGNLYGSGINDSVLIKYDAGGAQLWASRISHPEHPFHFDDMDLDAAGNVYLTGAPQPGALTVKTGSGGSQLWRADYHSTDPYYDLGQFVRPDGAGNVFMAGRSVFFGANFVSVVKYRQSPAAGVPEATVSPSLVMAEPGENVVLTATGTGNPPLFYQWRRNGRPIPGATGPSLALDDVQQASRGDYSVIVTNAVAVTISPEARLIVLEKPSVAISPAGHTAFAGGEAGFTASAAGTRPFTFQWRHNGADIPEETNNVLRLSNLSASDAGHYSVVVSNPAGLATSAVARLAISRAATQTQSLGFNGQGNHADTEPLLRLGPAGDVVVAARSAGTGTGVDIAALRYDASGALLWARTFNRTGSDEDVSMDLAVDAAGNTYVTGWSGQAYPGRAFTTLKYSPSGELLWARHFQGAGDSYATSIAVDAAGQATVGGRVTAQTGSIPVVVRYDAAGAELWVAPAGEAGWEEEQGVVVDAAGNTFLGTTIIVGEDSDFFLRKFDPSGGVAWTATFNAGPDDRFTGLALDPAGNVVMLGRFFLHAADGVVLKYTAGGERLWVATFDSLPGQNDFTRALAVDASGNITAVASLEDYDDDRLGTGIVGFDAEGRRRFAVVEPSLEVAGAVRIAADAFGNAYVTGTSTVKYDALGRRQWRVDHQGPGWNQGFGTAVAVDGHGDVIVAGQADAATGLGTDLLLLRYRQQDPSGQFQIGLARRGDGTLQLVLPPGSDFTVESSNDLREWVPATEAELRALLESSPPVSPPFQKRFFRLARPATD